MPSLLKKTNSEKPEDSYVSFEKYTGPIECKKYIRSKRNIHFEKKIIIPSKSKKSILRELDIYGIHEGSLFPDTEHKLKYLADSNRKGKESIEE